MSIKIKGLTYEYNPKTPFSKVALDNINLTINEGEFFGIIGHTGSGKSTLIQHLNALIKMQSGELEVAGINLAEKKANLRELRGKIGMVFQYPEYQLFAETVEKDVAFGLRNFLKVNEKLEKKRKKKMLKAGMKPEDYAPEIPPMTEQEILQQVKKAIELVGLDYNEIKDKSPFDLSGGQKRRVAFAGVIVTNPEILVLDEPTAGLDPKGKTEILQLVQNLKKSCTPTIIMVSHDMDEISEYADRIGVMNKGKFEFILPPKELFKNEERILQLGLDVPISVKIAKQINQKNCGLNLPQNIVSISELAEIVASQFKGGNNA